MGTERDAASGLPKLVRVPKLGFEMVLVPGGEFEMGAERRPASRPVHTRRVAPFYLARLEVTAGLWRTVMGVSRPPRRTTSRLNAFPGRTRSPSFSS